MALDTRNRRAAAVHIASPWRGVWPNPTGTWQSAHRAHSAHMSRQPLPATVYTDTVTFAVTATDAVAASGTWQNGITLGASTALVTAGGLSIAETLTLSMQAALATVGTGTFPHTITLGISADFEALVATAAYLRLRVRATPSVSTAIAGGPGVRHELRPKPGVDVTLTSESETP